MRPNDFIFLEIEGDDFVAQSYAFLLAGFETSATTMSFALYELSLQPDMQQKLRTEITTVLEKYDQQVTYEALQEMPYLEKVIFGECHGSLHYICRNAYKRSRTALVRSCLLLSALVCSCTALVCFTETLRKYPVVPYLDRKCVFDYELPVSSDNVTATLPGGTGVYIPVYAIHHDPQYYPEPETFDPERFTEENMKNRHQFSYLPFGGGPRVCLGELYQSKQTYVLLRLGLTRRGI
jgi:cytochrome P450 family 6